MTKLSYAEIRDLLETEPTDAEIESAAIVARGAYRGDSPEEAVRNWQDVPVERRQKWLRIAIAVIHHDRTRTER